MSTALAVEVGRAPIVVLTEVADLVRGVSYPKTDAREEPAPGYVPMLRATNIQNASLVLDSDLVFIAERNVAPDQLLRPGDIVVATSSGSKHLVGKSGQLHANWRGSFGAFCATVRPRTSIHPRYLALFFQAPAFWRQITKKAVGVNINNLRRGDLESLELPLPPLAVQASIVAEVERQLSRLDDAVASLKRVRANLECYKTAVLRAAVQGCLVPNQAELTGGQSPGFESGMNLLARALEERRRTWTGKGEYQEPSQPDTRELPPLPEGWAWARLDAVAELKGGITVDKKRSDPTARPVPYLRVANVHRGYLDMDEVKEIQASAAEINELRLQLGDILFNEGGDRDKLGRGWIWEGQVSECIHQNHVFRARPYSPDVSGKLISWWGNTFGKDYFLREGKQTTNLASINMTKLSAFPVPIPPPAEQRRIVAEVDRCLSFVNEAQHATDANLGRASVLRSTLLGRAFSVAGH
ncbi:MAG: restriction endonuclease subunit S [Burkholderiales bacterium]|nr:restriction endonuclease subunit S [Burkholderiales bacterium]